jgi:two-component system, OmpR family, phosphate regulon response regulator PhoB
VRRVLIVEDHRDIAELVQYNLMADGLDASVVYDGSPALSALRKGDFDLLVLGLMLPTMSGLEVCKAVRCDPALEHLPILVLTARGEESVRTLAFSTGANDYLVKPFHPRQLKARVRNLLCPSESPQPTEPAELPSFR